MAIFSNKELDKVLARVSRQEHERDALAAQAKTQYEQNTQQTEQAVKQNQVVETAL